MNVRDFFSLMCVLCSLQASSLFADACFNLDFIRRYNGAQGKIMQEPVYFRKNRKRCGRRRKAVCNQTVAQAEKNTSMPEEALAITQNQHQSDDAVVKF